MVQGSPSLQPSSSPIGLPSPLSLPAKPTMISAGVAQWPAAPDAGRGTIAATLAWPQHPRRHSSSGAAAAELPRPQQAMATSTLHPAAGASNGALATAVVLLGAAAQPQPQQQWRVLSSGDDLGSEMTAHPADDPIADRELAETLLLAAPPPTSLPGSHHNSNNTLPHLSHPPPHLAAAFDCGPAFGGFGGGFAADLELAGDARMFAAAAPAYAQAHAPPQQQQQQVLLRAGSAGPPPHAYGSYHVLAHPSLTSYPHSQPSSYNSASQLLATGGSFSYSTPADSIAGSCSAANLASLCANMPCGPEAAANHHHNGSVHGRTSPPDAAAAVPASSTMLPPMAMPALDGCGGHEFNDAFLPAGVDARMPASGNQLPDIGVPTMMNFHPAALMTGDAGGSGGVGGGVGGVGGEGTQRPRRQAAFYTPRLQQRQAQLLRAHRQLRLKLEALQMEEAKLDRQARAAVAALGQQSAPMSHQATGVAGAHAYAQHAAVQQQRQLPLQQHGQTCAEPAAKKQACVQQGATYSAPMPVPAPAQQHAAAAAAAAAVAATERQQQQLQAYHDQAQMRLAYLEYLELAHYNPAAAAAPPPYGGSLPMPAGPMGAAAFTAPGPHDDVFLHRCAPPPASMVPFGASGMQAPYLGGGFDGPATRAMSGGAPNVPAMCMQGSGGTPYHPYQMGMP